ncbi:MAG: preQ(1) synthase [Planctomycetota bacterium]|mgnify:FL=1|jgi:7-cyano-7-deazaguanine reductase|nr:preQ(1) synthase [Planctomycetota bacterium]
MSTLEPRQPTVPTPEIETFENPHPNQSYLVESWTDEFTCICPLTGQPDFATIRVRYVPGPRCFELKSFKLYLWSYRNEGHFHEDLTNRILADLEAAMDPIWLEVRGEFNVRGGIQTHVTARCGTRPENLE